MAQVMVNFRQDEDIKHKMESLCKELGFSPSIAYNMFARKAVREGRIPFEVSIDPFYSENNMEALRRSNDQVKNGKVVEKTLEELIAMEGEN